MGRFKPIWLSLVTVPQTIVFKMSSSGKCPTHLTGWQAVWSPGLLDVDLNRWSVFEQYWREREEKGEEKGEEEAREKTINHYKQYLFLHPHSLHGAFK
jgi:hypothetical protein